MIFERVDTEIASFSNTIPSSPFVAFCKSGLYTIFLFPVSYISLSYEKLQLLGIYRDKADKLPQEVKKALVSGEVTPLLQVSINARNGEIITLPLKLQMTADKNGNPALMAYPVRADLDESRNKILNLSPQEAERLRSGEVLRKTIDLNGDKSNQFLQLDPETKSVIHKRITELKIEEKLKDMEKVNDIELGPQQKQAVREGKSSMTKFTPNISVS